MTQDPSQTPPSQPQPDQSVTDAIESPESLESPAAEVAEAALTDAALPDASPESTTLEDVSSEVEQPQAIDSLPASAAPVDVPTTSATSPVPTPTVASSPVAEKPPATPQPPSSSKTAAFVRLVGQLGGIVLPLLVIAGRWAWQVLLVTLKWIREAWKVALPRIRTLLPEGWRKLPDWTLTTVAVALLIFVLWLTAQLLPGKAPATAIDRPTPAVNAPAPAQPAAPDPARIAEIQEQVAKITDQYAEGLIQSVQANFQENLLTVKLSDGWFALDVSSQAQLANELLKRSHKLNFDTLELADTEGELLARSPVVGSRMVVYERGRDEGGKMRDESPVG